MIEPSALTGRRVGPWMRLLPWAVVVTLTVGFATYAILRVRATYDLQRELALLRMQVADIDQQRLTIAREYGGRLDLIERNLYGDVATKLATPPTPTTVQLWQVNRDRELRDRILALERWRQRVDQ